MSSCYVSSCSVIIIIIMVIFKCYSGEKRMALEFEIFNLNA